MKLEPEYTTSVLTRLATPSVSLGQPKAARTLLSPRDWQQKCLVEVGLVPALLSMAA